MESIDNKRDMYAHAFNQGYLLGGVVNSDIISKVVLRRIVKQQSKLYYRGLLDGLTEKQNSLDKERQNRSFLDEIEAVRKSITSKDLPEQEI